MSRPVKLFAYKLSRDLHIDVDIIMTWQLNKLYEYMAFYSTETPEFQERYKQDNMTPEQRTKQMLQFLKG